MLTDYNMELVQWFKINFPDYYGAMVECRHGYDLDNPSPYHQGDDTIWEHTLCVYTHMLAKHDTTFLHLLALLHDIGKPASATLNHEKKRNYMQGHSGLGAYMAMDVLDKLIKENQFSPHSINNFFRAIAQHQIFWEHKGSFDNYFAHVDIDGDYIQDALLPLIECDVTGRVAVGKTRVDNKNGYYKAVEKGWWGTKYKQDVIKDNNIDVLIGPPCSGKSTYINKLIIDGLKPENVVSRDDMVIRIAGHDNYTKAWGEVDHKEVDRQLAIKFQSIRKEKDIAIDMCNMSKKSRKRWVTALRNTHNIHMVVFITPYDVIMERNRNRENKHIPVGAINGMMKTMTFPSYQEADTITMVNWLEN